MKCKEVGETYKGRDGAFDYYAQWKTDGRDGYIVQHSRLVQVWRPFRGDERQLVEDFYEVWYVSPSGVIGPSRTLDDGSAYHDNYHLTPKEPGSTGRSVITGDVYWVPSDKFDQGGWSQGEVGIGGILMTRKSAPDNLGEVKLRRDVEDHWSQEDRDDGGLLGL